MPPHKPQQLRRRPRRINRILRRLQAIKPELALLVRAELAAEVMPCLVLRVEHVVLSVRACLPHVEDGAGDALSCVNVFDDAVEEGELAVFGHVLDDGGAEVAEGGLGGPEGAEDSGWGGRQLVVDAGDDGVVDFVDEAIVVVSKGSDFDAKMMLG